MPEEAVNQNKISLFISYAHDDSDPFLNHLRMYVNEMNCPKVNVWYDGKIPQDSNLFSEINEKMMGADIVLFMVSPFFQASRFIENIEFPEIMRRYKDKECVIFPINTKTCNPMGPYQALRLMKYHPAGEDFLDALYHKNLQWVAYTKIQNAVNEEVNRIITEAKMRNDRKISEEFKKVIKERKIFLSVPYDDFGTRDSFLSWISSIEKRRQILPYRIVPSSSEADELMKKINDYDGADKEYFIEELFQPYINGAFCTIQIAPENKLEHAIDKIQFNLSRKYDRKRSFRKTISWCMGFELLQDELKLNEVIFGKHEEKRVFEEIEKAYSSLEARIKEIAKKYGVKEVAVVMDLKNDALESQSLFDSLWKNAFVTKHVPDRSLPQSIEYAVLFWGDNDENWFQIHFSEVISMKRKLIVLGNNIKFSLEKKRACIQRLRSENIISEDVTIIEEKVNDEMVLQFLEK